MDVFSTRLRCCIRSAAVKFTALLTLPAAETSSYWQRLGCAALLLESHCEQSRCFHERLYHGWVVPRCYLRGNASSRAVSTRVSITRCSEREVAVLSHLVRAFLRMSKHSPLDSFGTELIITEIDRCSPFGTPDRLLEQQTNKNLCM
jgi:hypothetical protein